MASDSILKRSLFGFKRVDVIDYIEKLQLQLSSVQQKCNDLSDKADECALIKAKLDSQITINDSLMTENNDIKAKLDDIVKQLNSSNLKCADMQSQSDEFALKSFRLIELIKSGNISDCTDEILDFLNQIVDNSHLEETSDENQFRFNDDGLALLDELYLKNRIVDEGVND